MRHIMLASCLALAILPGCASMDIGSKSSVESVLANPARSAHGLQWEASIPVLRNTDDDRSKNVFDPAIRGKTDRFVHLHREPK